MRSWLAHAAVFICVFGGFWGYCEWWQCHQAPEALARSVADVGGYVVTDAGDETYNGVYVRVRSHAPPDAVYFKAELPHRYLWEGPPEWHLSTERAVPADGYVTEPGADVTGTWVVDGAIGPAPTVSRIPEVPEPMMVADR